MNATASRSALIVACANYQDPGLKQLRAPAHDASGLAEVLGDPMIGDFNVRQVLDQPDPVVRRELSRFFSGREPSDTLLVHFSCHGVKDEAGQLYFAATDTELDALDATALPADFLHRQMNKSRSRRMILLLDCCYSGAFTRGMQHRGGEAVDLQERLAGHGRVVLTASSATEYAFEGTTLTSERGVPSVFTSSLVEGLRTGHADRDGDGYISVDELYDYVYEQVQLKTPGQTPRRWSFDVQGELLVASSVKPLETDLPPDLQAAIQSHFPEIRFQATAELGRLVSGRHRGLAVAAQAALAALRDGDDSLRVRNAAAEAGSGGSLPPLPDRPSNNELSVMGDSGLDGTQPDKALDSPQLPPRAEQSHKQPSMQARQTTSGGRLIAALSGLALLFMLFDVIRYSADSGSKAFGEDESVYVICIQLALLGVGGAAIGWRQKRISGAISRVTLVVLVIIGTLLVTLGLLLGTTALTTDVSHVAGGLIVAIILLVAGAACVAAATIRKRSLP